MTDYEKQYEDLKRFYCEYPDLENPDELEFLEYLAFYDDFRGSF